MLYTAVQIYRKPSVDAELSRRIDAILFTVWPYSRRTLRGEDPLLRIREHGEMVLVATWAHQPLRWGKWWQGVRVYFSRVGKSDESEGEAEKTESKDGGKNSERGAHIEAIQHW